MLSFSTSFLHPSTFREEPVFSLESLRFGFCVYTREDGFLQLDFCAACKRSPRSNCESGAGWLACRACGR